MEFSPAVVERFTTAYQRVAGVAHVARSADDVPGLVHAIVEERGATCVALANLVDGMSSAIAGALGPNVRVLTEPFDSGALPGLIDQAQVGVTGIAFGIAQTGTLVEIATDDATRLVSALPRVHIGVVRATDLLERYDEAAPRIRALFEANPANCVVSFLSGPSRTGDIELKLTLGVHGPESAHAIVVLD
ncbi:MAG: lactate utilization protein [Candidatus Hydrogenedentes bacterium]|nr:lactate utilization protein [Candidatus Hydrogenedentota bacterium]